MLNLGAALVLWILAVSSGTHQPVAPAGPDVGTPFVDCLDCPEMVLLPSRAFTIGSPETEPGRAKDEGPRREVTLPYRLAVSRYEIRLGLYRTFMRETGRTAGGDCITDRRTSFDWKPDPATNTLDPGFAQGLDHPAVCVSWHDAEAFVEWLNHRAGGGYRLPTEAEWEFAARAGSDTAYSWGASSADACAYINGFDQTAEEKYPKGEVLACSDNWLNTAPVGSFRPNAFGLHDMTGNVGEWTASCATPDYANLTEAGADMTGDCSRRMVRGGSWGTVPRQQRSAERMRYAATDRDDSIGIRVVKTVAS